MPATAMPPHANCAAINSSDSSYYSVGACFPLPVASQADGTFAVDHFMREKTEAAKWWAVGPRVVHSDFAYKRGGASVDSDITG